jgi:hypothetical protein
MGCRQGAEWSAVHRGAGAPLAIAVGDAQRVGMGYA